MANSIDVFSIIQAKSTEDVFRILNDYNAVFNPLISSRISDIWAYADKLYKNAFVYIVVNAENKIIGFIAFYANDTKYKISYLTWIGILPSYQNKRIGETLLNLCIKVAKEQNMSTLKLEVRKHNDRAIAFYSRNGFYHCGEASEDSLYMMKIL